MDRLLRAVLSAAGTALVLIVPAAVVDMVSPGRAAAGSPATTASADGITVTSVCTTTLSVAAAADHPRWDYRVVSGSTVLVPASWVGDGLITSVHYLQASVRRHQILTVVGTDGTRISVQASARKCR